MPKQQTIERLKRLNSEFSVQGHLRFISGPGELLIAEISNDQAQARIVLQGAQVLSWQPDGQQPVIWLSEDAGYVSGKSIRGGIPVCWPWFGAHPDRNDLPSHGFARTAEWQVIDTGLSEHGETWILLSLPEVNEYLQLRPPGSGLVLYISVGSTLDMKLITRNGGSEMVTISQALHSYFVVSDISNISIKGLEQCEYIDALDDWKRNIEADSIKINSEIDRIYQGTKSSCLIEDSGFQRQILINTQSSASTVVWNPWIEKSARLGDMGEDGYLNMVCVESGNIADDIVSIDAGEVHCLSVSYEIKPL